MDCRYELGQHTDIAPTARVAEQEIKALTAESDWEQLDLVDFSDIERSVVHLVSELLTTHSVPPALFADVHKALGSEATIEVLMVIGRYAGLALMLNALDVDLDESARLAMPARRTAPPNLC
jgi:alkylhydroperoxidase family enzyme